MKTFFINLVAVLLISMQMQASDDELHNGNWWRTLSRVEKMIYTNGLSDGVMVGEGLSPDPQLFTAREKELLHPLKSADQVIDGIDSFYQDFKNRSIPTYSAFWFVAMEIKGVSSSKLEEIKTKLRQQASRRQD